MTRTMSHAIPLVLSSCVTGWPNTLLHRVAELTGLTVEEIVHLARAYATTQPAAIRTLIGMEHHANGAMTYRALACLPALVGAWRRRGGGMPDAAFFHFAAINAAAVTMQELQDPSTRTVNMVQIGEALTNTELDPPIRALIVYSSNPATIAPNQNLVRRGLAREDLFTVVHEQFLTDTAAYADYVLPATTQVEQLDLMWSWGHTYLSLNQPAIAPLGEAVSNTELFRRLAGALGMDDGYLYTSDEDRIRAALNSDSPFLAGITFERLQAEGWAPLNIPQDWAPFVEGNFATLSGKCEFYAESAIASGIDPLPAFTPAHKMSVRDQELGNRYTLVLITAKSALHFLNSSYADLPRQLKAEGEPRLDIHALDAASRNISEGDQVCVYNDLGEVTLRARVGDLVRPGVVAMPSGWWASLSPGGASANCLTSDGLSDLGGGGDFHDTLVEVKCMAAMQGKRGERRFEGERRAVQQ